MDDLNIEFAVRNYFSMLDGGQASLIGRLAAPGYRMHFTGIPEPLDLDASARMIAGFQAAFPDLRHAIQQISRNDGRVEVDIAATGTQRNVFQGVPASGRAIAVPTRHTFRFEQGLIAEHWIAVDMADILRQIGALPDPSEANKAAAVRLFTEVINQEDKAVIDQIFAADAILHDPFTGDSQGIASFKGLLGVFDTAFPHHRARVEQVIAEGSYVAVLHTHLAVHTGPFLSLPPTGRTISVNGLELFRFAGGKIAEFWRKDDDASLLIQLGALPAPQAA